MTVPAGAPLHPHTTLRPQDLRLFRRNHWKPASGVRLVPTFNARAALYQLCHALPKPAGGEPTMLLPALHCYVLADTVARAGFRPVFYRIRRDLTIDYDDLLRKAEGTAAVLVIHFFGFPADLGPLMAAKRRGASWAVIEDWAHSFVNASTLALNGDDGDFSVYSFYKVVPTHVGGGLRINREPFAFAPLDRPIGVRNSLVILKRLAEEAIDNSGDGFVKRSWRGFERWRVSRKSAPPPAAAPVPGNGALQAQYLFSDWQVEARLPWMSRWIFGSCDLRGIVAERQRNYRLWTTHLKEQRGLERLLPQLPDAVCPWAYPVMLSDRGQIDFRLHALGVPLFTFGETLYPTVREADAATQDDAWYLSQNLLLLGVHQALTARQIEAAADATNRYLSERAA